MKLNNRGWGYATMFLFMGILITFLIIVWLSSYRVFENIEKINKISESNDNSLYYKDLEEKIKIGAKAFVDKFKYECYLPSCKVEYIQIKTSNLITDFVDYTTKEECDGYVIFNDESYKSYIKCENYETKGY